MSDEANDLPADGWWPEQFTVTQWFRKGGRSIAQVIRQSGGRWRAYSMIELAKSAATGKPLAESTESIEQAKAQCVAYAEDK